MMLNVIRKIQVKTVSCHSYLLGWLSTKWKIMVKLRRNWNPCAECKWCSHYSSLSKSYTQYYPVIQQVYSLDIYSSELKARTETDTCTLMFIVALFTVAKQ